MTSLYPNKPCSTNPLWSASQYGICDVVYRGTGSLRDFKYYDFVKKLEAMQDSYVILDEAQWKTLYIKDSAAKQGPYSNRSIIKLKDDTDFYTKVFLNYVDGPLSNDYYHAHNNPTFTDFWILTEKGKTAAMSFLQERATGGRLACRTEVIPVAYKGVSLGSNGIVRYVDFLLDYNDHARWTASKDFWYDVYKNQILLREIARKVLAPNIAVYACIEAKYNSWESLYNTTNIGNPEVAINPKLFGKYTLGDTEACAPDDDCKKIDTKKSIQLEGTTDQKTVDQYIKTASELPNAITATRDHYENKKTADYLKILDGLSAPSAKNTNVRDILVNFSSMKYRHFLTTLDNGNMQKILLFYRLNSFRRFILDLYEQAVTKLSDKAAEIDTLASMDTNSVHSFSTAACMRRMIKSCEEVEPRYHPYTGASTAAMHHIMGLWCETSVRCTSGKALVPNGVDIVHTKLAVPDNSGSQQLQSLNSFCSSDRKGHLKAQHKLFMVDVTRYTEGLGFYKHAPAAALTDKLIQIVDECARFNGENLLGVTAGKTASMPMQLNMAPRHSVYTVLTDDARITWIIDRKVGSVYVIAPQWRLASERHKTGGGKKLFAHNDADVFFAIRNGLMPPPFSFSYIQRNFREEYLALCEQKIMSDSSTASIVCRMMLNSKKPVAFNIDIKTGKAYIDQTSHMGMRSFS